jgi:RNA polymerase sigma factor (sigma-70 family)
MAAAPQELQDLLQAKGPAAREEAWSRFVIRFSPLLLHTARTVAREYDRAMDAYAHVLEQLHQDDNRRLTHFVDDPRAQFTTWLVVVARRICVDFLRQRYGRTPATSSPGSADQAMRRRLVDLIAEEIGEVDPVPDPRAGPDEALRNRDLTVALHACLARLSPTHRLLLVLRFENDVPVREIAGILRYPTPFHVYRALNASLAQLRHCLDGRGVGDAEP